MADLSDPVYRTGPGPEPELTGSMYVHVYIYIYIFIYIYIYIWRFLICSGVSGYKGSDPKNTSHKNNKKNICKNHQKLIGGPMGPSVESGGGGIF